MAGLALAAFTCGVPSQAAPATAFAVVGASQVSPLATDTGAFTSPSMSVEVVLAPRDQAGLNNALTAAYDPASGQYQNWLAKGQFDDRYAPAAATRAGVESYLRSSGLTVSGTSSPFLVRASGSSTTVSAAFHTSLRDYRNPQGVSFYANSAGAQLPQAIAGTVLGVLGLTNTVRPHSSVLTPKTTPTGGSAAGCESPYPTTQQVLDAGGVFYSGYGGAPGCNGLTPSQLNGIYGAPKAGPRTQGAGVTLGVFEQSAYRHSDVAAWTRQFYGPGFHAPLVDIPVDGGTLTPACPTGDTCPAEYQGYAADIEVDADVETQLAIAPDAAHILVYSAPYDLTGETALDEYTTMADDDAAASISESYGNCENDVSAGYVQAENLVFEQMALQGQSVFGASGDSGAFDCVDEDGTTRLDIDDPPSQPWVTSVGGTSLESDNPGTDEHPSYPGNGIETAWNVHNLCNTSADEGGRPGYYWCASSGASGGGNSQYWGAPSYQRGPGVESGYTEHGNGTTSCTLAAVGTPCRETPDISAVADGFNGYAVYCTGDATTPNSPCAGATTTPHGWIPTGGTSLSSPLWSGIVADRDSFLGHRSGNINPVLYALGRLDPSRYFHDITGIGPNQSVATNNGYYPSTPGYDLATGIGTPKMTPLITQSRF